ncbi:MAG: RDD family protein, partial [Microbacterium sp.]
MTQPSFGTVAPTSRRAVAYIIDALIAAGIGIILSILLTIFSVIAGPEGMLGVLAVGGPIIWLLLVGWFVFYTFMQAGNGSIGMRAQGLRLVREADGTPLGFGKALLRNIIFGLSAAIVVGYFTPLFDGSGRFQGWHDKVVGSLMLDVRASGGAITAPPTQAVSIPPRPSLPNAASGAVPNGAPPIPGLATPTSSTGYSAPAAPTYPTAPAAPASPAAPAMDSPAI